MADIAIERVESEKENTKKYNLYVFHEKYIDEVTAAIDKEHPKPDNAGQKKQDRVSRAIASCKTTTLYTEAATEVFRRRRWKIIAGAVVLTAAGMMLNYNNELLIKAGFFVPSIFTGLTLALIWNRPGSFIDAQICDSGEPNPNAVGDKSVYERARKKLIDKKYIVG